MASRTTSVGALVAVAVAALACSWSRNLRGHVVAEDGGHGAGCAIRALDPALPGWRGTPCGPAGGEGGFAEDVTVPLGDRFRCRVSANTDKVYAIEVRCPGYAPLETRVPVTSCAGGFFGGCDDVNVGGLTVRR